MITTYGTGGVDPWPLREGHQILKAWTILTQTQKQTTQSIVNIFETSEVLGNYGQVTVMSGDTGHLTFGRSEMTLGSGNPHTFRSYDAY